MKNRDYELNGLRELNTTLCNTKSNGKDESSYLGCS